MNKNELQNAIESLSERLYSDDVEINAHTINIGIEDYLNNAAALTFEEKGILFDALMLMALEPQHYTPRIEEENAILNMAIRNIATGVKRALATYSERVRKGRIASYKGKLKEHFPMINEQDLIRWATHCADTITGTEREKKALFNEYVQTLHQEQMERMHAIEERREQERKEVAGRMKEYIANRGNPKPNTYV